MTAKILTIEADQRCLSIPAILAQGDKNLLREELNTQEGSCVYSILSCRAGHEAPVCSNGCRREVVSGTKLQYAQMYADGRLCRARSSGMLKWMRTGGCVGHEAPVCSNGSRQEVVYH